MLDTLQEIIGAIKRNKMRTVATGFAVASGLFLIIVLQGAGNGVINSFESNMGNFAFAASAFYIATASSSPCCANSSIFICLSVIRIIPSIF